MTDTDGPPPELAPALAPALRDPLESLRGTHAGCVRCGYERRGLPNGLPCPECSAPPPPRDSLILRCAPSVGAPGSSFSSWIASLSLTFLALLALGRFFQGITIPLVLAALPWVIAAFVVGPHLFRSRPVPWVASVGGLFRHTSWASMRTAWQDVGAIRVRRRILKIERDGLPPIYLRTKLEPSTLHAVREAFERFRAQAILHPEVSPQAEPVEVRCQCGACGALLIAQPPMPRCPVCGNVTPPDTIRIAGRASPAADRRVDRSIDLFALSVCLVPLIGLGIAWLVGFRFAWFAAIGALIVFPLMGISLWQWNRRDTSRRGHATDRLWLVTENGLSTIVGQRVILVPFAEMAGLRSEAESTEFPGWRQVTLELTAKGSLAGVSPPVLWIRNGDRLAEEGLGLLHERVRAQRAGPI